MITRERVLLTLLGLADPRGRLESFAKTEALDYAQAPDGEFERALKELISDGFVRELERVGRSRRFEVLALTRRSEGLRYIAQRRDFVLAIDAQRAQLEPGRATLIGTALPPPRVVRAEPMAPDRRDGSRRWNITLIVPGLGTVNGAIYTEGESGFVLPPATPQNGQWTKVIEWTADFARSVRDAAREFVAASS
jgi:hypothetical protein